MFLRYSNKNLKPRPSSTEDLIPIGKILREWGVKGEMKAIPLTPDLKRVRELRKVIIISPEGQKEERLITSIRQLNDSILISFDGCNSPEEASRYRGCMISIRRSESPRLPEGYYYYNEIIGLEVFTVDGNYVGKVEDIIETKSNDVYIVKKDGSEYLIPAIRDVIKKIDLKANKIIIEPMNGLLD